MENMDASVIWFLAAVGLVALELVTGTLYLLMIALGAGAAGLAAYWGVGPVTQFLVAGGVSVLGSFWARRRQGAAGAGQDPTSFDTGQPVEVIETRPDGSLRVAYRGSHWDAELAPDVPADAGPSGYRIQAMRGSRLVLTSR